MKKETKQVLYAALALVVSVSVYAGATYLIGQQRTHKAVLEKEIGSWELKEEYIRSLHTLADETSEGRTELASYFVSKDNPGLFLSTIEEIGRDAGVLLEVVALEESKQLNAESEDVFGTITITLDASGSWTSVYRFLRMIENAPYALTVKTFWATRQSPHSTEWEIRMQADAHNRF